MTITDNTSPGAGRAAVTRQHAREHCRERLVQGFWVPSSCPRGLAEVTDRLDVLTDADEVCWDGGPDATAHYLCACCGAAWTEDWPAPMALGPYWRETDPVHWVAGVDSPRYTAGQIAAQRAAVA